MLALGVHQRSIRQRDKAKQAARLRSANAASCRTSDAGADGDGEVNTNKTTRSLSMPLATSTATATAIYACTEEKHDKRMSIAAGCNSPAKSAQTHHPRSKHIVRAHHGTAARPPSSSEETEKTRNSIEELPEPVASSVKTGTPRRSSAKVRTAVPEIDTPRAKERSRSECASNQNAFQRLKSAICKKLGN